MVVKILTALSLLIYCVSYVFASRFYLHMLQLESYYLAGYRHHMAKKYFPMAFIALLALCAIITVDYIAIPVLLVASALLCLLGARMLNQSNSKKPLNITGRIKRIMVAEGVIVAAVCACIGFCLGFNGICCTALLLILLMPFVTALAKIVCQPIELACKKWYIHDAERRLKAHKGLKIIGITGSYGKTSVKFILSAILSERFAVLTPPGNYNTTLGVVRVIRERLRIDDEVFICEMGSRHVGDIKEICDFVHPQYGIISSIGPQHLETFGSMERLVKGKFELIDALGKDGVAFFPDGNEYTRQMHSMAICKKYMYGFNTDNYIYASDITVSSAGCSFALCTQGGQSVFCTTALLGDHNIQNITGCAAIAYHLGMTLPEIARGISKIKPVEHRLEIVARSPYTIIDDAYNSSPNGARAALKVLQGFTGKRIIITPGFVELGDEQEQFHQQYGNQIAQCADVAILVGKKRTQSILQGALAGGMPQSSIYSVNSLDEASALMRTVALPGDAVLFENDLPDNY